MLKNRTLLVVGAGASCEVGLPSGFALKGIISSLLEIDSSSFNQYHGDSNIVYALLCQSQQRLDIMLDHCRAANKVRQKMSLSTSIDELIHISEDKEIEICAKLAITKGILEAEKSSSLYLDGTNIYQTLDFMGLQNIWHKKFFEILGKTRKSELDNIFNNLTIITFNYDRCIEHFLAHALMNLYDIKFDVASNLVNKLQIIHPYGLVGHLPWQPQNGLIVTKYGEDLAYMRPENFLRIASGIKTFTQQELDKNMLSSVKEEVAQAESIIFLGFGFHKQNMDILRPSINCKAKQVLATTKGMSDDDQTKINDEIKKLVGNKNKSTIRIKLSNCKCHELFDEYKRSIIEPSAMQSFSEVVS